MGKKFGKLEPYLYLTPALIYFTIFSFYPFIKTVLSSFFVLDANGVVKGFAGLDNYVKVLMDPLFIQSIFNTLLYVVLASPVAIIIALILALVVLLLHAKL